MPTKSTLGAGYGGRSLKFVSSIASIRVRGLIAVAVLSIGVFGMPNSPSAGELVVTQEVYLEHGSVPEAKAVARAYDNGFVIVGKIDKQAWATKTDADGNVKWRQSRLPIAW
jgi:hypothetical protein